MLQYLSPTLSLHSQLLKIKQDVIQVIYSTSPCQTQKEKRKKKCSTMWLIRFSEWIRLQIWFERSEKCKQLKPMQLFINSAGLKLIHSLNQQSKSCGKKEQMTNMKISLINSKIYIVLDEGWKSMCYNHVIFFSVCYQIEYRSSKMQLCKSYLRIIFENSTRAA